MQRWWRRVNLMVGSLTRYITSRLLSIRGSWRVAITSKHLRGESNINRHRKKFQTVHLKWNVQKNQSNALIDQLPSMVSTIPTSSLMSNLTTFNTEDTFYETFSRIVSLRPRNNILKNLQSTPKPEFSCCGPSQYGHIIKISCTLSSFPTVSKKLGQTFKFSNNFEHQNMVCFVLSVGPTASKTLGSLYFGKYLSF